MKLAVWLGNVPQKLKQKIGSKEQSFTTTFSFLNHCYVVDYWSLIYEDKKKPGNSELNQICICELNVAMTSLARCNASHCVTANRIAC
jgi:hypothetical protein